MIGYSRAFNELYGPKPIERKNKMNKRILKIFNEAGFHQPEMERLGIEDKFEKFAELIVKYCATICNTVSGDSVSNASEDYQEGREMGAIICRNQILKHFGVEE